MSGTAAENVSEADIRDLIVAELRKVFDPEIPINIYDLGLIYAISVGAGNRIDITMTLTAPACPVAGEMPEWVAEAARAVPGCGPVNVRLVWDPPWSVDMLSEEAKLEFGLL